MNDIIRMLGKVALQMVLWVFVLSISWGGRTLFDRAHGVLVENSVVEAIDSELAGMWSRISETAKVTFSKGTSDDSEAM
jgi:hypothetical protein